MSKFNIAHLREQGVDMIIIPLEPAFGYKSDSDQHEAIAGLQACAASAGLAGTVVPIWKNGNRVEFIAPKQWHTFFKSLSWDWVLLNINKELTCG